MNLDNIDDSADNIEPLFNRFFFSKYFRNYYRLDQRLIEDTEESIQISKIVANQVNTIRELENKEEFVKASEINALGILNKINRVIISHYQKEEKSNLFNDLKGFLENEMGVENLNNSIIKFVEEFPPENIENNLEDFVTSSQGGRPNYELLIEQLLLLWLQNSNNSFTEYSSLLQGDIWIDDPDTEKINQLLGEYLDKLIADPIENTSLLELLLTHNKINLSLDDQLETILKTWGTLLSDLEDQVLTSIDLIREENKIRLPGAGESEVYVYDSFDPENFTSDREWMPNVILLTKNTYVWLDQLSKKYKTEIVHLDHIPDIELDIIAKRGFNAIWLIGIWERSKASRTIKNRMGNPEAIGSAYSICDYEIASDLGGHASYKRLKQKTERLGIILAADMVPNHMAIDSKWIINHPEWFISRDNVPFPSYSYSGKNLSESQSIGIYVEDHYFDHSDAAVVFKRKNMDTGRTHYIYHGNDGTSISWNDTAQLNFLKEKVREKVIQKIIHVAKMFQIIRFDAAMTLTKQHFQRLWYPIPGTGGDIPTRHEYSLSKKEFDDLFPNEFWKDVVDRINAEVPNTLLLAEAFWLLEGYFVRSLGMHRVYNSAFMHMLTDEENENYRKIIINTLKFNPEILKRFVNYMTNPDEIPSVIQFGKDDKYFGICILMVTLPGLPMFGHGQIEGFEEKYGMEYSKQYWNESIDEILVKRHEKEVFPLLRKRNLFSGIEEFRFYDFYSNNGIVNENVYVLSNKYKKESALIIFNNRYEETVGWIKISVPFRVSNRDKLNQSSLGESLGLRNMENHFCIFTDYITGLHYLRKCRDIYENGLYIELKAFKYHVFLDFKEIFDDTGKLKTKMEELNGKGVNNIN